MTRILIASPTYDGSVRMEFMKSVLKMTDYFRKEGIEWELMLEPATVLHTMRSVMASKALMDENITHLLFIDTDMGFPANAVKKLLESGKDVVGCAYPFRTVLWDEKMPQIDATFRTAVSSLVPYAVKFAQGTVEVQVANGLCEVKALGTGLLLISKTALQIMRDAGAVERFTTGFPYSQWYSGENYLGFFDHLKIDQAYLGEDYSFCHRWTENCGGKIFAVVDEEIAHIGNVPVLGRYIDKLKAGKL